MVRADPFRRRCPRRPRDRLRAGWLPVEAANNAGAQTSFIPMLTLGIVPGPQVISSHPTLFWGMIASMWIGNLVLLVINLPLVGLWVRLLKVPYRLMYPTILVFCCVGIYSINSQQTDVLFIGLFGLAGLMLGKLGFETAPLLLGFVLGELMEENLRRAMVLSRGDASVFLTQPWSAVLLLLVLGVLVLTIIPAVRQEREDAFTE